MVDLNLKRLWYTKPAKEWVEALPLGNGRLGAMVFGGIDKELIQLNEDTLWSGRPHDKNNTDAINYLEQARTRYHREMFISSPHQALIMRFTKDGPGKISFVASLDSLHKYDVKGVGQELFLDGRAPVHVDPIYVSNEYPIIYEDEVSTGMCYRVNLKATATEGSITFENQRLVVKDADEVLLVLVAATSFNGFDKNPQLAGKDFATLCREMMQEAEKEAYDELRTSHVKDYQALFNRMEINLGKPT